jgi:enoyl-CoA hydratase/carnithine racemase
MISGRTILADEAQRLGLVQAVHPSSDLLSAAQTLARDIATGTSPLAVAATRKMLWQMTSAAHPQAAFELESRMGAIFGPSADASEGVQAFFDKRAPVFTSTVDSLDQLPW